MRPLLSIQARNFRSLRRVNVTLGSLNVLVGPNEAGKSNFLDLIEFLGDSARYDLADALERRGGYDRVRFRGVDSTGAVSISVRAAVTTHSSENAPDEYDLTFWSQRLRNRTDRVLFRNEDFTFKRTRGRGRRISVHGNKAEFLETEADSQKSRRRPVARPLRSDSLALSTLRRLPAKEGGEEIERFAELFTTFRVFNVDVARAKRPARLWHGPLRPDASNLANAIVVLSEDADRYEDYIADARAMIPGFRTPDPKILCSTDR